MNECDDVFKHKTIEEILDIEIYFRKLKVSPKYISPWLILEIHTLLLTVDDVLIEYIRELLFGHLEPLSCRWLASRLYGFFGKHIIKFLTDLVENYTIALNHGPNYAFLVSNANKELVESLAQSIGLLENKKKRSEKKYADGVPSSENFSNNDTDILINSGNESTSMQASVLNNDNKEDSFYSHDSYLFDKNSMAKSHEKRYSKDQLNESMMKKQKNS